MRVRTIALAGLAGAAVAYLFDPVRGSARRRRLRERLTPLARLRPMREQTTPPLPDNLVPAPANDDAEIRVQRATERVAAATGDRPMDDAAIAGRIRATVFGQPDLRAAGLVVNVVRGVASIRGQLRDAKQIDEVVDLTRSVPGVQGVENLIRIPDSPSVGRPSARTLGDAWNG